jgi:hypothetical protein
MNASTSAGAHCHGYWLENSANRRTSATRVATVDGFKNRVCCCRVQPSNIASNTAGAGSR